MSNTNEGTETINPTSITTQAELEELLIKIGFSSHPVMRSSIVVMRKSKSEFKDEPRRNLIAQDNNLTNHSMVIIDDSAFAIYYYDEPNDLYRIWDELRSDVKLSELRDAITSAMTIELVMKRLGY